MTRISRAESAEPRFDSKYARPKFRNYGAGYETIDSSKQWWMKVKNCSMMWLARLIS